MKNITTYEDYKATINEWLNRAEPNKRYIHYNFFMTENMHGPTRILPCNAHRGQVPLPHRAAAGGGTDLWRD